MATTRKKAADDPAIVTFADKFKGMEVFMAVIMVSIAVLAGSAAYGAYNTGDQLFVGTSAHRAWQTHNGNIRYCHYIAQNFECTKWYTVADSD